MEATAAPVPVSANDVLIARAKSLELDTHTSPRPAIRWSTTRRGFAKIMCSAVFITGLDPDFAAENVGYFTSPYAERAKVGKPVIDRAAKAVHVTLPNGVTLTAKYLGSQGCVTLPGGQELGELHAEAGQEQAARSRHAAVADGRRAADDPLPAGLDAAKVKQAVDAAFEPAAEHDRGVRRDLERAGSSASDTRDGITTHTPLESWSMGKSVTATLMGVLIKQGAYELSQPAPIPEWQSPGDPRAKIRIADILHMSSGLRIKAPRGSRLSIRRAPIPITCISTRAASTRSNTRPRVRSSGRRARSGRYRNTDPVLINYLIRLAVEKRGEDYLSFPQRALFDKIGIRTMVIETDPFGNFLGAGLRLHVGARLGTARQPVSSGRRLERRADSARGVRRSS